MFAFSIIYVKNYIAVTKSLGPPYANPDLFLHRTDRSAPPALEETLAPNYVRTLDTRPPDASSVSATLHARDSSHALCLP